MIRYKSITKTSVTSKILHHEWMEDSIYINPDIVAQEKFGDWNSKEAVMQSVEYCEELRERCLVNCCLASKLADRTYIYDNSVEKQDATLLFRLTKGNLTKQYTSEIPEWASYIYNSEMI